MNIINVLGYPSAALVGAYAMWAFYPAQSPQRSSSEVTQVTLGEVTGLIERLKLVADKPNAEWYSNGINITFTGRDVSLKLKTKNGNEYNARANQLKDAVQMIADPALDVRNALNGYNAEAQK